MGKTANIAVLVSGGGTNLQALINAQNKGIIKSGAIRLVLSNNASAYALKRAEKAGIAAKVVTKKQFGGDQTAFETALISELENAEIDLIVLAGFMSILSERFTAHFEKRIINVHPSLIPSFCGAGFYGLHVHEAALEKGVKVTGATVQFVNEIPDGGELILQQAVAATDGHPPKTLQKRVMRLAEWKILPQAAEMVCAQIIANTS
ncbi:MAG: phosphoribosylglycinamide formyltransferase [Clostridia bacterium]|nr:phosphoribosylglycinamide formyltransferase [Clostridia bacterium]